MMYIYKPFNTHQCTSAFTQEFFFLKTFGVIGLAIAFVIGQAASALVNAFVKDIIDAFIGLFLPAGSLAALTLKVAYKQLSRYNILEDKTKGEKK
jgi:large-conductance mechanosensitive channel